MSEVTEVLADYPYIHRLELPPNPDEYLHINNVQFIEFMGEARRGFLGGAGCPAYDEHAGTGHVVVSNHCDYKGQLNAPDTVWIGVRAGSVGSHAIKLDMRLVSGNQGKIVAEAYVVVVPYDFKRKAKLEVTEELRQTLQG